MASLIVSYLKHAMLNIVVFGIDWRGSLMGFGLVMCMQEKKKAKAFPKTISASNQVAEEAPWQELPLLARRCKASSCQKLPWSTCLVHGSFVFQPELLSLIICVVETLNRDRAKVNKFHLGDIWGSTRSGFFLYKYSKWKSYFKIVEILQTYFTSISNDNVFKCKTLADFCNISARGSRLQKNNKRSVPS